MKSGNLWPKFNALPIRQPITILKEQASFLMEETNNLLSADVVSSQSGNFFYHKFLILAPVLNNYKYELLTVRHTIFSYPSLIYYNDEPYHEARNEEGLVEGLSMVFNNPSTSTVITSLLSQSMAM